jgi:hypothetical protein
MGLGVLHCHLVKGNALVRHPLEALAVHCALTIVVNLVESSSKQVFALHQEVESQAGRIYVLRSHSGGVFALAVPVDVEVAGFAESNGEAVVAGVLHDHFCNGVHDLLLARRDFRVLHELVAKVIIAVEVEDLELVEVELVVMSFEEHVELPPLVETEAKHPSLWVDTPDLLLTGINHLVWLVEVVLRKSEELDFILGGAGKDALLLVVGISIFSFISRSRTWLISQELNVLSLGEVGDLHDVFGLIFRDNVNVLATFVLSAGQEGQVLLSTAPEAAGLIERLFVNFLAVVPDLEEVLAVVVDSFYFWVLNFKQDGAMLETVIIVAGVPQHIQL